MLPKDEWLPHAKRLAIGGQSRIQHRREGRMNLVVGNDRDRWWCYCQSCKEGGVEMKEHVRLEVSPEAKRSDLSMPKDMVLVSSLGPQMQHALYSFIATKGMDACMLPELWYSDARKRLLINTPQGWMGRDVTGKALEKWLTYNRQHYLHEWSQKSDNAIVVEDTFSFYKIRWAIPEYAGFCALGTGVGPALANALLDYTHVYFMFDGDLAGWKGAYAGAQRMRGLNVKAFESCAPAGLDPKDLSAAQIRAIIKGEQHE